MSDPSNPGVFGQLEPRYLGPVGNRVSAVAGVPGDHLVYYAGAASGGIWKTTDGGTTWSPIFDHVSEVSSIGALAVSESNPNVVWAGTGESWIRGPISIGDGLYRSVDGGANWTHLGLDSKDGKITVHPTRFSKIIIHPTDPDVVWAAALGSCYAPTPWCGVFKTIDGGQSWERVLHARGEADVFTGCSDLAIDPNNPAVLYAGLWQFQLRSWTRVSGGPGSGLYKSVDGGEHWRELTRGLPSAKHPVGKISVGVAASDSNYVYASIETGDGEPTPDFADPGNGQLWQSTDAGESWSLKSYNRNINSRAAYYTRNAVSPDNRNEVYFLAPEFGITVDGGDTLTVQGFPRSPGVDHHEAWIDPTNGDRIAVASDYGLGITQNRGQTWHKIALPIAQMYNVSVDRDKPYNLYGNCQDKVATWGPSNARVPYNLAQGDPDTGMISRGFWITGGPSGECGYTIPDPKYPDLVWSSGSSDGPNGGQVAVINRRTGHWRLVTIKPRFTTGTEPKHVEYRFHWHLPLAITPCDDKKFPKGRKRYVFAGSQYVHATDTKHGQRWVQITPEPLTGCDDAYLGSSGGLTADNINVRMAYTTSAIAESPCEPGLLWVGTSDQRLWLGRKGKGEWQWHWRELSLDAIFEAGLLPAPEPGAWALVSCIVPSRFDAATAYVAFDRHQADDPAPYIFKTSDFGKHWQKITGGITTSVVSYVHWLAEDQECPGLLFAGTENALYISFDDGEHWQPLPGLPQVPVSGIVVQKHFSDLVVSTFGRGFWIFDDITPLRKLAAAGGQDAYLFEMTRPVYRFQDIVQLEAIPHDNDPAIGTDPRSPAPINFYLGAPADVTLTIYQGKKQIREIEIPRDKTMSGINRCWWDLQSDTAGPPQLRTNPPNQMDTRYCPSGIRPYSSPVVGTSLSWLVAPGTYSVQLTAEIGGKTVRPASQEIHVLKDPTARPDLTCEQALAAVAEQTKLNVKIWKALKKVILDINAIEFVRFQIQELAACIGVDGSPPCASSGSGWIKNKRAQKLLCKLDCRLLEIEDRLLQRKITGQGEDLARFPARLVENLAYLGSLVAGAGDFRPTDEQYARYRVLESERSKRHRAWKRLRRKILDKINPRLHKYGVPTLLVDPPDSEPCPELFETGPAF